MTDNVFFAFCVAYTIRVNGHISGNFADNMSRCFDQLDAIEKSAEESIIVLLMDIDNALADSDYNDAYIAAKHIKEILRDCNMWQV